MVYSLVLLNAMKIGQIIDDFHSTGILPIMSELLKRFANGVTRKNARLARILGLILSAPSFLFLFKWIN